VRLHGCARNVHIFNEKKRIRIIKNHETVIVFSRDTESFLYEKKVVEVSTIVLRLLIYLHDIATVCINNVLLLNFTLVCMILLFEKSKRKL